MYKICKTEESARRQRQLEQGLLDMLHTRDYGDITVSDLCDKMGVSRKSFYRYFSGKEGALAALIDHTLMEFEQTGRQYSNGAGRDLVRYFEFWLEHKRFLYVLNRNDLYGIFARRATLHATGERLIPGHITQMSLKMQQLALSFVVSGLMAMVQRWQETGYRESPQEMAQVAAAILGIKLI